MTTREQAQKERNLRSKSNPIVIDSSDDDDEEDAMNGYGVEGESDVEDVTKEALDRRRRKVETQIVIDLAESKEKVYQKGNKSNTADASASDSSDEDEDDCSEGESTDANDSDFVLGDTDEEGSDADSHIRPRSKEKCPLKESPLYV
eukprot:CAMPEP_0116047734 /NCGR_PEP_ID=MMETSP0321-20121206/29090_1 /TAXON_ID=163516 /ORGANISM="Leptocylindrus danicus var. danicus, Strain B650" /LENGTH=146 /DNA_ID=CAMNT_0003529715 /DNA_START=130 /DNA_END=567 /DNA_ORIENTATION=-